MKIDIYTLQKEVVHVSSFFPVMLDVLKIWSRNMGWEVRLNFCREDQVDVQGAADVVAFSVYTGNANAVYRVSKKLRQMGKIVIMGGPHLRGPNCKEAFPHSDVVAHSIYDQQWFDLLREIESGRIEPDKGEARYIEDTENLFEFPSNFYEAYPSHKWYHIPTVYSSLGCPHHCVFCNSYQSGHYKTRDIDTVYNEILHTDRKVVFITDASFGMDRKYAMALMEALAPLKKTMATEITLGRLQDEEMLDMMARGGIETLFVGVETLASPLRKHGAVKRNLSQTLNKAIQKAHDKGIKIVGSFIAGLDNDDHESFEGIYDFYKKSDMDLMYLDLLTPYPNTDLFYQFKRDNRLLHENWDYYDYHNVVFRPLKMSIDQLIAGYNDLYEKITDSRIIAQKCGALVKRYGLTSMILIITGCHLFNKYDAGRKRKDLMRQGALLENLDNGGQGADLQMGL